MSDSEIEYLGERAYARAEPAYVVISDDEPAYSPAELERAASEACVAVLARFADQLQAAASVPVPAPVPVLVPVPVPVPAPVPARPWQQPWQRVDPVTMVCACRDCGCVDQREAYDAPRPTDRCCYAADGEPCKTCNYELGWNPQLQTGLDWYDEDGRASIGGWWQHSVVHRPERPY